MTPFEPTILVKRLVVMRNAEVAYDEEFHGGVNVVRGENASGKSTVLNFIFYGLGGDLSHWSSAALLCTNLYLEVQLNQITVTMRRAISDKSGQPMDLFVGNYETAIQASIESWKRYPYRSSSKVESFSQSIFRILSLPEVNNEATGNITMHQLLRLLYADQLSPVDDLFKFEQFDPPNIRDAVSRLLCGAYESRLYENELKIKVISKQYDEVSSKLSSLFAIIGKTGKYTDFDWIQSAIANTETERLSLAGQIETLEKEMFESAGADAVTLQAEESAYEQVRASQVRISELKSARDQLIMRINDSAAFISRLEAKLKNLNESKSTAEVIGSVFFQFCPSCFSALENSDDTHRCSLCKSSISENHAIERISSIMTETAQQVRQSTILQNARRQELELNNRNLDEAHSKWKSAAAKLQQVQRLPSTELRNRLKEFERRLGYLDKSIDDLEEKKSLASLIGDLSAEKADLLSKVEALKDQNSGLRASQETRLSQAYSAIADQVRYLLKNDLRREEAFELANNIQIDFVGNKIAVDGQRYFSASSRVILKSSFYLGFFAAATKLPQFRHPRFVLIDTIEDKGMEVQRSHNFQIQIKRVSDESKVPHQIIYATSMIAPELDEPEYTIGDFSKRDTHTLAIET
jgi:hypothetical protein